MTMLGDLSGRAWVGPCLLVISSGSLLILNLDSELIWGLSLLALGIAVWGFIGQSRWLVAVPTVFMAGMLGFDLTRQTGLVHFLALPVIFLVGLLNTNWLLPSNLAPDLVIAYAGGIGLLELFLVLRFWPVNTPSRSIVLTAVAFLMVEYLDRRTRGAANSSVLATFGIVTVAIAVVVLTADWQGTGL